jgi:hypothetical protein
VAEPVIVAAMIACEVFACVLVISIGYFGWRRTKREMAIMTAATMAGMRAATDVAIAKLQVLVYALPMPGEELEEAPSLGDAPQPEPRSLNEMSPIGPLALASINPAGVS